MFYGKKPFEIGRIVRLIKEPDNEYDKEAIGVYLPFIDRIGYVANSTKTVYAGTYSAGRAYDLFDDYTYAKIMFVTHSCAIALLLDKDEVEQPDDADEEPDEEPKKPVDSKPAKTKKSSKNPVGFKA
ncbi:MAG: HIRAN domain-containing protein [Ruminococcus sp.]|nr:HIRAN domain-containing protein [Ruminococcus sp.]